MEGRRISGPGHALKGSTRQVTSERSCAIQVEEPEAVIIRKPSEDDINEIVGCLKVNFTPVHRELSAHECACWPSPLGSIHLPPANCSLICNPVTRSAGRRYYELHADLLNLGCAFGIIVTKWLSSLTRKCCMLSQQSPYPRSPHPGSNRPHTTHTHMPQLLSHLPKQRPATAFFPLLSSLHTQLKRSMLTVGACERVRKLCKVHPNDCLHDAILGALIELLVDAPASPVAGAAMEALSMLALTPEGRQKVCLSGGAIPLLR